MRKASTHKAGRKKVTKFSMFFCLSLSPRPCLPLQTKNIEAISSQKAPSLDVPCLLIYTCAQPAVAQMSCFTRFYGSFLALAFELYSLYITSPLVVWQPQLDWEGGYLFDIEKVKLYLMSCQRGGEGETYHWLGSGAPSGH